VMGLYYLHRRLGGFNQASFLPVGSTTD
jgi:hypothetical protein